MKSEVVNTIDHRNCEGVLCNSKNYGCYIYTTNNLKDCLSWCYNNLNLDFNYY